MARPSTAHRLPTLKISPVEEDQTKSSPFCVHLQPVVIDNGALRDAEDSYQVQGHGSLPMLKVTSSRALFQDRAALSRRRAKLLNLSKVRSFAPICESE